MTDKIISAPRRKILLRTLRYAFPKTIPVLTGFLVLGVAYGVLMKAKGFDALWSVAISAIAFCGSMQFVAITLLTTVFDPIQAFLLSIMVNARHLFYGISMLEKYNGMGKIKYFLIYTLCDETFSIASSVTPPDDIDKKFFYFFISLFDYLYWIIGTFLGGLVGNFITFNTKGLDFVLTALFVVLFVEQLTTRQNAVCGILGLTATAVALIVCGSANLVIPAMVLIVILLVAGRKKICF